MDAARLLGTILLLSAAAWWAPAARGGVHGSGAHRINSTDSIRGRIQLETHTIHIQTKHKITVVMNESKSLLVHLFSFYVLTSHNGLKFTGCPTFMNNGNGLSDVLC